MKICDLHTHVLPGVDDGAQNMDYALQMLQNAVASDVEFLAVTPHLGTPQTPSEQLLPELEKRFHELQQSAVGIPIKLALGAEVRVSENPEEYIPAGRIPTMNGSRYLLTEFPVDFKAEVFPEVLDVIQSRGYVPLIAHPERYSAVCRQPEITMQWLDMGCHLQLTGGSILGQYGKTVQKAAAFLIRNDLVACVASDAHGLHKRSNFLLDVYDHLSVHCSKQYAQCLMYTNPLRIWHDESL